MALSTERYRNTWKKNPLNLISPGGSSGGGALDGDHQPGGWQCRGDLNSSPTQAELHCPAYPSLSLSSSSLRTEITHLSDSNSPPSLQPPSLQPPAHRLLLGLLLSSLASSCVPYHLMV